jgi:hypothetical protein
MTSETTVPTPSTAIVHAPAADAPPARPVRRPMAMGAEPVWMALFDPARFTTMKQMAGILLKSGFLPRAVNSEEKVITILIKGYELGLPPMEALTGISVIDGKPAVSPQLMIALINRSGQLKDLVVDGDDTKCSVTMTRRGRKPHTETFTIDDARRMKSKDGDGNIIPLADKYNWRQMPAVMLRWRAVSACARVVFPDVISGVYTPEEMGADVTVDDEGAMHVVDAERSSCAQDGGATPTSFAVAPPVPATPDAASNVDLATGEVIDIARTEAPTARAVDAISAKAPSVAAGTTGPVATQDETSGEPEELTLDDARELRVLIAKAAQAEGHTGKAASRAWVAARYGFTNGRLEDVPRALRGRIRADALRILSRGEHPNECPSTPTAKVEDASTSAATGNGDTARPSTPEAETAESVPPTGTQLATANQLEEIRRQCALRGIVHPEHDAGMRQAARRDIDRLEDLTQAQADRVIRYLKYITNEMIPNIAKRLGGTVVEVRSRSGGPTA